MAYPYLCKKFFDGGVDIYLIFKSFNYKIRKFFIGDGIIYEYFDRWKNALSNSAS